ncbi:pilus assembly protein TadG-related protein [Aquipuribacter sp. SD81]|uniref:pilus assembly protein TadG-related protein n=1 Tax=Aquipuribacter sp. SD81 TaxID=3127703 RepID=UPI003018A125
MQRRCRRVGGDRGSTTLFVVVLMVALLLAAGLVTDGAGRVQALQRADTVAAEAARAAGQELDAARAVQGDPGVLDTARAAAAARAHLAAAGVEGSVRTTSVPTPAGIVAAVTVTARVVHDPVFLGGTRTVTGTATARLAQGVT